MEVVPAVDVVVGQCSHKDSANKVQFSMFCYFPDRFFDGAEIIHPDCGVGVVKAKALNAHLQDKFVTLRNMWRLALVNAGVLEVMSPCLHCGQFSSTSKAGLSYRRFYLVYRNSRMRGVCGLSGMPRRQRRLRRIRRTKGIT